MKTGQETKQEKRHKMGLWAELETEQETELKMRQETGQWAGPEMGHETGQETELDAGVETRQDPGQWTEHGTGQELVSQQREKSLLHKFFQLLSCHLSSVSPGSGSGALPNLSASGCAVLPEQSAQER
ncbi:hypothetical protein SRHO_G00002560 [Serrasalmus rhombeus]